MRHTRFRLPDDELDVLRFFVPCRRLCCYIPTTQYSYTLVKAEIRFIRVSIGSARFGVAMRKEDVYYIPRTNERN